MVSSADRRPTISSMVRSGLRRYPRELLASVRERAQKPEIIIDPCLRPVEEGVTLASAWLGHASLLARVGRRWVLADPVFSGRIGPRLLGRVMGLGRQAPVPAIAARLPTLDAIFITHAHYDHLDRPTLERLASGGTIVVTPRRTGRLIPAGFDRVIEAGAGEVLDLGDMSVRVLSPRHWGARRAIDRARGCNAYLIESGGRRVFIAGDTAETGVFDELGSDRPIDLAAMGIGAYDPWWHQHATPEQVWAMFQRLRGRHLLPVHHSTYPMSDERPDEPMERLLRAAGDESARVVGRDLGEVWAEE